MTRRKTGRIDGYLAVGQEPDWDYLVFLNVLRDASD
jgi:hypothetical protein